jgi:hypothetical protein
LGALNLLDISCLVRNVLTRVLVAINPVFFQKLRLGHTIFPIDDRLPMGGIKGSLIGLPHVQSVTLNALEATIECANRAMAPAPKIWDCIIGAF